MAAKPAPEPTVEPVQRRPTSPPKPAPEKRASKEVEKREKKPARIKAQAGSDAPPEPKKKGKQLKDTPKKPVGRKELRPGLTQLHRLHQTGGRRTLVWSTLLIAFTGVIGAGIGIYRGSQLSRQRTFREMELASLEAPKKNVVTVLISTDPPGASVYFDDLEMSDVTPMALERDRDDKEHSIELKKAGHTTVKHAIKYDDGLITRVHDRLSGKGGKIAVESTPESLTVEVDGAEVGETPIDVEVASGEHTVRISGRDRDAVEEVVTIEKGETKKISRAVAKKGQMGFVSIDSEPRAEIFLNGQSTGRWTGDGPVALVPNVDHHVTLKAGKRDGELVVKLKKGEKKRVFLDLGGA